MGIRVRRNHRIRRYRPKKLFLQDQFRLLAGLILAGFLFGSFLYFLQTGDNSILHQKKGTFTVNDGLEIHEEVKGLYKVDAQLPQIVSDLKNTTDLSAEIAADFYYLYDFSRENIAEAFSGWKNPTIRISYQVKNKNQVYDLVITTEISSIYAYNALTITKYYSYDAKRQKILKSKSEVEKL